MNLPPKGSAAREWTELAIRLRWLGRVAAKAWRIPELVGWIARRLP